MARLTDEQIIDMQETFNLFDNKGDGKIFYSQLGDTIRAMGLNPTETEVNKCFDQSHADKRIGFDTFLPIYQTILKTQVTANKEDFIDGFRVFDKDQGGYISSAELRHLLTSLGEKLSDDEVDQLLQGHEDNQGNVNYEDCKKLTQTGATSLLFIHNRFHHFFDALS